MHNRRTSLRQAHRETVVLRSFTDQASTSGQVLDLSEGGALVEVQPPLRHKPTLVALDLTLGGTLIKLHAVVQHLQELQGKEKIGLRFVYLGNLERQALRLHLRTTS
jgi:c-di-GMP-binding flagellar brake protein YcgR